jgi:hypothetical protein
MPKTETKPLWKTKTFAACVGVIAAAALGWASGELTLAAALQTAATGLIGLALRHKLPKVAAE